MQKKIIFSIMCILVGIMSVKASSCPKISSLLIGSNNSYYNAGSYANVNYCDSSHNLKSGGCFPLSIASIVDTYYNNTKPEDVATFLCSASYYNKDYNYSGVLSSSDFQSHYELKISTLNGSIDSFNTILNKNEMVLASIIGGKFDPTPNNSSGHYVILAFKDENGYYVMNTGAKATTGYFNESDITTNIINKKNQGFFEMAPTGCDNTSPSGTTSSGTGNTANTGNGTSNKDPFSTTEDITITSGETTCGTLFVNSDGSLNELGKSLNSLYTLIKIATPALVLILTTIDYAKAIASQDDGNIKKSTQKTIKRLIIGLFIFFLPFLLDLLFHLFGLYSISRCNIGG